MSAKPLATKEPSEVMVDPLSTITTRQRGSTDVQFLRLEKRDRGRALRHAWMQSSADMVCYMDVDLSTDLTGLLPTLRALHQDGYDLAAR